MNRSDLISQSVNCEYQILTALTVKVTVFWDVPPYDLVDIVTYLRIARQRLDKHPAICAHVNKTNVYSSLLGNSKRANRLQDSYHMTCFMWSALSNNRTIFCVVRARPI
jgi:hypothetical protein